MIVKKGSFVIEGMENIQINIGKIVEEGWEQIAEGPSNLKAPLTKTIMGIQPQTIEALDMVIAELTKKG